MTSTKIFGLRDHYESVQDNRSKERDKQKENHKWSIANRGFPIFLELFMISLKQRDDCYNPNSYHDY
ncbi:hypothetical protein J1TS3_42290 [Siminovitchia fordii]|uniref:Uncharacterized protein n=1 Tax=Siminovitchia fordii TaxID=254759 RepID=A0ABQ4KBH3_9BACI|nr:hypothetical protein J1TS3_42290 [Siminovitchia fordii]